jgi:SAM-dependent methyltransferase
MRGRQVNQLLADNYMRKSHMYWEQRSSIYDSPVPDVFGRNVTGIFLRKLRPKSLVEVGCGTGQLFPLYKQIPHVVGCDWTDGMLLQAQKRLDRHSYPNIQLKKLDITRESLPEKFDVALTRTVLMHIAEEDVDEKGEATYPLKCACENLTRMADTVVLFEFYDPTAPQLEWHNFHHEYPLVMRGLGYEISEAFDRPDGMRQMLMVYKKQKQKPEPKSKVNKK